MRVHMCVCIDVYYLYVCVYIYICTCIYKVLFLLFLEFIAVNAVIWDKNIELEGPFV